MANFINEVFYWVAYSSEVQSIIIMAGHGEMQEDMVLERYLDLKGTGSGQSVILSKA